MVPVVVAAVTDLAKLVPDLALVACTEVAGLEVRVQAVFSVRARTVFSFSLSPPARDLKSSSVAAPDGDPRMRASRSFVYRLSIPPQARLRAFRPLAFQRRPQPPI